MPNQKLYPQNGPLIIAEIGGNHGGSLDLAKNMVDAALAVGGRAVKFQTYRMEAFVTPDHPAYDEFSPEALSYNQFRELSTYCHERGAVFLSTPFDLESADLLDELDEIKKQDDILRKLVKLPPIHEDIRKMGFGGTHSKPESGTLIISCRVIL